MQIKIEVISKLRPEMDWNVLHFLSKLGNLYRSRWKNQLKTMYVLQFSIVQQQVHTGEDLINIKTNVIEICINTGKASVFKQSVYLYGFKR